ncbi:PIN domain-containing protein [Saccharothrix longispora]|uniref:Ribonuclease VapC n=1 Tax=Saccharothrix longispora TaxID=33920 RepID=A0ABU1Q577_9PSEU|nr:PIN domain-containing protein [Saccharothrix longispora]MDR6598035.1 tRNA(fMet)-specific endonuclease VapC [Saccharothrix longispora]
MARLILDTGVLVAGARGVLPPTAITDEDDVALPAVALAEYLTGILLDRDPARSAAQRAFLGDLLAAVPVEDYTPAVAEHHAELLAHVKRSGNARGAHDLIIAATARATNRTVVTTDERARFGELPAVAVRVVSPR